MASGQVSQRTFFGVSALLFGLGAALTVIWCESMSAMGGMPMPGGWTMSMAWMRMPGESWTRATASFVGMWMVMMAAMMLPSFAPVLWRYRESLGRARERRQGWLTTLVCLGYFFVWTLSGLAVFPAGTAAAAIEMQLPAFARSVPIVAGLVVIFAGAFQFATWKTHHLTCCRQSPGPDCVLPACGAAAWRLGLRLGRHCCLSCANLTAILLVIGVMDWRAMAAITAAITAERLAPSDHHVARAIGAVVVGAGLLMLARALDLLQGPFHRLTI